MKDKPERKPVDYGDFTEYHVRCLIAEYCKGVTIGTVGWGVSFKDWVELQGIAKHDGMFRLIKLEEENETKFSPWGFEVCAKNVIKIQKIMDIKKLTQERELKFRVWDKLRERFTTCESGYQGHYILSLKGEFHNLQNGSGGKEYIVQQYTGLKDKNGKEIYEGDIIQLEGSPISYSIEWDRYQWAINAHGALGYDPDWNIQPFNHCVYERASVVGNVFENPELLKQ